MTARGGEFAPIAYMLLVVEKVRTVEDISEKGSAT